MPFKSRFSELIAADKAAATEKADVSDLGPLGELFKDHPIRRVYSRLLDEQILFATDTAQIPPNNTLVVYRASELVQLVGISPASLRAIHLTKVVMECDVVTA